VAKIEIGEYCVENGRHRFRLGYSAGREKCLRAGRAYIMYRGVEGMRVYYVYIGTTEEEMHKITTENEDERKSV